MNTNVLVIVKTRINQKDGNSLSIKNWFSHIGLNSIYQIYSGSIGDSQEPIAGEYRIDSSDRRFGFIFEFLKNRNLTNINEFKSNNLCRESNYFGKLIKTVRRVLKPFYERIISSGIWESVFEVKISDEMRNFIINSKPVYIFAQGFDVSFMRLPLLIKREFNIPICFSIVDDWIPGLYADSPKFIGIKKSVHKLFIELLASSHSRVCISHKMAEEYTKRYGMPFDVQMQVDKRPIKNYGISRVIDPKNLIIGYSGSLALKRWRGILHLSAALDSLRSEGVNAEIHLYVPYIPDDAEVLLKLKNVSIYEPLLDEEVINVLSEADIVFLPESFDEIVADYIKYSLSTKAHIYMMTGSIPLVYGPAGIGTVDYAADYNWGYVVDKECEVELASSLRRIIYDKNENDRILVNALDTFNRFHSPVSAKEYFSSIRFQRGME